MSIAPSLEVIKQSRETIRDLLDSHINNTNKTALLQLLDSTLSLLPEETDHLSGDTTELVEFLRKNIKQDNDDPNIIAVAVARFTDWHKSLIKELFRQVQTVEQEQPPEIHNLHQEIKELKEIMSEEINALRQDIRGQVTGDRRQVTGET